MNIAVAAIGHNNPPATPFELSKSAIDDLYAEAKNWLDGDPIASQEQADEVQKLMRLIQAAEKEADARRVAENEPFDKGKAEVQAKYAPLISNTKTVKGMTVRAVELCKEALKPWLIKVDEENQRKAEAARAEALAAQQAAMDAMRQRQSLADAERAEELVRQAKEADAAARKAGNATAAAKGGGGRAVTLRDYYTAEVEDYTAFARHAWGAHRSDMQDFLDGLAKRIVDSGCHSGIPGVKVNHDRRPA